MGSQRQLRLGFQPANTCCSAPIETETASRGSALSVMLHLLIGFLALFSPPPFASDDATTEPHAQGSRFVRVGVGPLAHVASSYADPSADGGEASPGGVGSRSPSEEGDVGKRTAKRADEPKHYAIVGTRPRTRALLRPDRKEVNAGILGVLPPEEPKTPFFVPNPDGDEKRNAIGALLGDEIGTDFGYGGLELHGTGRGSGGDSEGCLCCAYRLEAAGHGGGGGLDSGYGRGVGKLGERRRSHGIVVAASVPSGGREVLSSDLAIEIRWHARDIAFCYEQALDRNPRLGGTVTVRLAIAESGEVVAASLVDLAVVDTQFERCTEQAMRRWLFPPRSGAGTTVVERLLVLRSP